MSTAVEVRGNSEAMLFYRRVMCLFVAALCYSFPDGAVFLAAGYLALLLWRRR